MPKKPDQSPVLKLFENLWGNMRAHSWRDINGSLQKTLSLAIEARLEFEPDDFKKLSDGYKGHYWMGDGEHYYRQAIEARLTSACQSFEKWKGRPPFIFSGKRLHVGCSFVWDGKTVHVTSYGHDHRGHYLGCVTYKKPESGSYSRKVDKRLKVSLAELKKGEPKKDIPKPEKDLRRATEAFEDQFRCETAKQYLKTRLTLKAAWEGVPEYFKDGNASYLESARRQMLELLRWVKFPIMLHEIDELKTVEQIYARVGDFEKSLQPLILAAVKVRLAEKRAAKQKEKEDAGNS